LGRPRQILWVGPDSGGNSLGAGGDEGGAGGDEGEAGEGGGGTEGMAGAGEGFFSRLNLLDIVSIL